VRFFVKKFLVIGFALLCGSGLLLAAEIKLYVSPGGRDMWSGRLVSANAGKTDGPLASLEGARDAIRAMRKTDGLRQPVTVEFSAGRFPVRNTVVFEPGDSGTKQFPITYKGAPGAKPVISGARLIKGWKKHPTKPYWMVTLSRVKEKTWYFRQLFVDDRRAVRARHPNVEKLWHFVEDVPKPYEDLKAVFTKGALRPTWRRLRDVEVILYRSFDISRVGLHSVDHKTRTMKLDIAFPDKRKVVNLTRWATDKRYYLENALEFLDSPGEWFLDVRTGILYLRPFANCDMTKAQVFAPMVDRLMQFAGQPLKAVEYIRFEHLSFEHSGWNLDRTKGQYDGHQADVAIGASIDGDHTNSCGFSRCSFRHIGRYAIWFRKGCRNNRISDCEFYDLGAGAVEIGRPRAGKLKFETTGNEITRCHIREGGLVWHGACGIWVGGANHTRVAYNHIHDIAYSGMSVGWNWADTPSGAHHNIIEYNHIHDVMKTMADGGGVYLLGRQDGTILRNNIIHDMMGWHGYSLGLYTDAGASGMLIENNLVARTGMSGIGMGLNDNTVRNNIIAFTGNRGFLAQQGTGRLIERNIIFVGMGHIYRYGGIYPDDEHTKGKDTFRQNLYHHSKGEPISFPGGFSLRERRERGFDVGSVCADPLFVDAENGDFRLKPGSPALKLGFKPFKLKSIGPNPFGAAFLNRYAKVLQLFPRRVRVGGRISKPRLLVNRRKGVITIDGKIGVAEWKNVETVALTETPGGREQKLIKSEMGLTFDKRFLYVFVRNHFPPTSRTGSRWGIDDGVEICIRSDKSGPLDPSYVLRGFPSGKIESVAVESIYVARAALLGKGVKFAADAGMGKWSAEFRIPLKASGITLGDVNKVFFNVAVRCAQKDAWASWVGSCAETWRIEKGGKIVLGIPSVRRLTR